MFVFALAQWLGCTRDEGAPDIEIAGNVGFAPMPAVLHRLTDGQYRNSVRDLTGVAFAGTLPLDYVLHGYTTVGGAELTVPPLDLEQYEAAAWDIAAAWMPDASARDAALGCAVVGVDDALAGLCVRAFAADLAHRAWRRPIDAAELDALVGLWSDARGAVSDELVPVQAVAAAILLSPHFVYRVEVGQTDPARPDGWRRATDHELAARLSYFLTDTTPDAALLADADAGQLAGRPDVLAAHAERLLASDGARAALGRFWHETLELDRLTVVEKNPDRFPQLDDGLRASMAADVAWSFDDNVFVTGADFRDLFTSPLAYVDPALAAVYGVPAPAGGTGVVTLPAEDERGGLIGRAALLTLNANPSMTSPTKRGKFVRTRLLCQPIPPPPPGVVTALDEAYTDGTLRDQLEQHSDNPACHACHARMDPLGFALEHFDPIGQRVELDNGLPIDATGDLDGVPFDGAAELGAVVADSAAMADCMVLQLYSHALGHAESDRDLPLVSALSAAWQADGMRFRSLALDVAASEGFALATGPDAACADDEQGRTRACATACGSGQETCSGGLWTGCAAPVPVAELCNGIDDDCDGAVDEGVERACEDLGLPGVQTCSAGAYAACTVAAPIVAPEVCNGLDDDGDGATDEGLDVELVAVSSAALAAEVPTCDADADPASAACRTAVHHLCVDRGCAAAGFGPVASDGTNHTIVCLSPAFADVSKTDYTTLATRDPECTPANPIGADCNDAVHRSCADRGDTTGFGPIDRVRDTLRVVCTPHAEVITGSYPDLAVYDPGCDGIAERVGPACSTAVHLWCLDHGYASGHGPIENKDSTAMFACLEVAP